MSDGHDDMHEPYWSGWLGRRVTTRYPVVTWRNCLALSCYMAPQFNRHSERYVGLHPSIRIGPWLHSWFVPITPQAARPKCSRWIALRCMIAGMLTPSPRRGTSNG